MIVNNNMEIKYFYRFVEFTSKLLGVDLPHERFKLIVLDNFKAESKEEINVKNFAEAYLYLINNTNQSLTITVITKTYYLLTNIVLEEDTSKKILEVYYQNYDETSHYLAALVHFAVLNNIEKRNVEFAFMLSNLIMLKKQRHPFIPYVFMYDTYFKAIEEKNLNKLMLIFAEVEVCSTPKYNPKELNLDNIINEIKFCKLVLKRKFNVKKLYLYGSYAKQKTSINSDLDLLVIFDKNLMNFERCRNNNQLIKYLSERFQITVDLLDFTHAMTNLDINEMENIITLI